MTDTTISDAVFYPEDEGTGVPDGDEDYDSAAYDGLLSQALPQSAILSGLDFADVVTTDGSESVNVTAGACLILDDASLTGGDRAGQPLVQSGFQQTYDVTLPTDADPVYVAILPTQTPDLALDTDVVNDIWIAVDPVGTNDTVYIRHGSGLTAPSDPSHKLGTVDSTGGTTRAQWGLAAGDGTLTYPDFSAGDSITHKEGTQIYDRAENTMYVEDGT